MIAFREKEMKKYKTLLCVFCCVEIWLFLFHIKLSTASFLEEKCVQIQKSILYEEKKSTFPSLIFGF